VIEPVAFIDSDVIISSLLSQTGAAFALMRAPVHRFISNYSEDELAIVVDRLRISSKGLKKLIQDKFSIVQIDEPISMIRRQYTPFIADIGDAHIVCGAKRSQSRFLITYNTRHFHSERIQQKLDILGYTPAMMLQYLRVREE
jgi:predicted nucleic acid-binding protein